MDLTDARLLAESLMREHGLDGWAFGWDRARTRAGACHATTRRITLSRVLTQLHTPAEVRDTLLHEIAHALVGPEHGHDGVWRATALRIGCSGRRCVPETAARAPAPWRGECPAGHVVSRHRRPVRVQACARCSSTFDAASLIRWTFHGRPVAMDPRYTAELARIRQTADVAARSTTPAPAATARRTVPPAQRLPVGAVLRVSGSGRYGGLVGVVVKRGRTRYHVRTAAGLLTVPFTLARPVEVPQT